MDIITSNADISTECPLHQGHGVMGLYYCVQVGTVGSMCGDREIGVPVLGRPIEAQSVDVQDNQQ